jgi:hypothetical protein
VKDTNINTIQTTGAMSLFIGLASIAAGAIKLVFPESVGYEINPFALIWFGVASTSQHTISKLKVKLIRSGIK